MNKANTGYKYQESRDLDKDVIFSLFIQREAMKESHRRFVKKFKMAGVH